MQLRFDEDLIEAAVALCAAGRRLNVPALQIARYHRERERLYVLLDPDERNAAFFKLHLGWFAEWGLEKPLRSVIEEFPNLRSSVQTLSFRKSYRRNEEGAELYVSVESGRNAVVTLRIERFARDEHLLPFLRHELTHVDDMVSPTFGYSPTLDLPGLNAAQYRLVRERYRLLWAISIDGRLAAAGHMPISTPEQHATDFSRGYAFWSAEKQTAVFDSLWRNPTPRHADFLNLIADPRGTRDEGEPSPGASCPLCGFSTFDWCERRLVSVESLALITAEFPAWSPEQGLCSRCRESYDVAATERRSPSAASQEATPVTLCEAVQV